MRLVDRKSAQQWDGRGHFFAAAAEAMRRILVDHARRRNSDKRTAGQNRLDVYDVDPPDSSDGVDLLALDEALDRLAAQHPQKAELVKLRYFVGLTLAEAATSLGLSVATAERDWAFAKAWLHRALSGSGIIGQSLKNDCGTQNDTF